MILLGIVLLILGFVFGITALWVVGLVLIVLGAFANFVPLGGTTRRWY
jgi:hypothetical protein